MATANIFYDRTTNTEILFSRPVGTSTGHENNVIDYLRVLDNKLVSWLSSSGVREIEYSMVVETTNTATMERTMDYFRSSGRPFLLMLPTMFLASEITIKDIQLVEQIATTQTYKVSAICYGVEGVSMLSNSSGMTGTATNTTDTDSCSGLVTTLSAISEYRRIPYLSVDEIYLEPGNYVVWVRAKSTAGTANDMTISVVDNTSGSLASGSRTVTSTGYAWYGLNVTVPDASLGHTINVEAIKATSGTNTLYIDSISIVRASGLITVSITND